MSSVGMTRREWGLLLLLIVSIFINYVDRGSLSIAVPALEKEMSLSPSQLGMLLGAFFWTYALLQLFGVAGWLADQYSVGAVLGWGFFVWSAATMASGLVHGFAALFVMRLLLGAGESVAYPCYSRMLARDFPQHHRGVANALLDAGSKLGPALGTLLGGLLMAKTGWRGLFIGLGAGSLLWLIPWLLWMPRGASSAAAGERTASPAVLDILRRREAWGAFAGHFCGNYYWFFLLTWLPGYLVKERGYSIEGMAQVGFAAYLAIAAATVVAGWVSDRWIARGATVTRARKTIVVGGLLFSTVILPVAAIEDRSLSLALLFAACMAFGTYTSNHWAITQTLAGPHAAGRWTSIQNGIGNLSGIVAAWLTGVVVENTGAFHMAFVVSAAIAFLGAVMWGAVVREVKTVEWEVRA